MFFRFKDLYSIHCRPTTNPFSGVAPLPGEKVPDFFFETFVGRKSFHFIFFEAFPLAKGPNYFFDAFVTRQSVQFIFFGPLSESVPFRNRRVR